MLEAECIDKHFQSPKAVVVIARLKESLKKQESLCLLWGHQRWPVRRGLLKPNSLLEPVYIYYLN